MKRLLILFIFTIVLTVSVNTVYAFSQNSAESSMNNPAMTSSQVMSSLSGKVVESMNSGGYSYVAIEKDGKKKWVAVPQIKISIGQDISFRPGMVMKDFKSKTLKRTFESIVFSSGVIEKSEAAPDSQTSDQTSAEAPAKTVSKTKKASGPDAYTVAELYEKSTDLDKKGIVVRARIVKVSPNIMGKNWLHIQDGSGSASKGNNDVIVTTSDLLSVGDVVTVKGTLYKNKDFGSGYKYAVIVEEAGVKK